MFLKQCQRWPLLLMFCLFLNSVNLAAYANAVVRLSKLPHSAKDSNDLGCFSFKVAKEYKLHSCEIRRQYKNVSKHGVASASRTCYEWNSVGQDLVNIYYKLGTADLFLTDQQLCLPTFLPQSGPERKAIGSDKLNNFWTINFPFFTDSRHFSA